MWLKHTFKQTALFSLILSITFGLISPGLTAFAVPVVGPGGGGGATISSSMPPTQSAESYEFYNSLTHCIKNANLKTDISLSDIQSGLWFEQQGNDPTMGYFLAGAGSGLSVNGDHVSCGGTNTDWIVAAALLWGYDDALGLFCAAGGSKQGSACNSPSDPADLYGPKSGTRYNNTSKKLFSGNTSKLQSNLNTKIGGAPPTLSDAAKYALVRDAFKQGCLKSKDPWTGEIDQNVFKDVKIVDNTGKLTVANYYGKKAAYVTSNKIWFSVNPSGNNVDSACASLVSGTLNNDRYVQSYVAALAAFPDGDSSVDKPPIGGGGNNENENTCGSEVKGLGWIVCPVINSVSMLDDGMWKIVKALLNVNPLGSVDGADNSVYKGWSAVRNIANVLFVVFFLIIIFSQLTSIGINNYGVKKLLPKVIIGAVLVNISYIIIQIGVDVSNIAGAGLYDLILTATPPITVSWNTLFQSMFQTQIVATAGAGLVLAAFTDAALLVWVMLPFVSAAALALVVALGTLIVRQAMIPVLALLAPLAFVAYMLPNTESWFKKWWKLLLTMLMMYPLAAIVFAGAQFAGSIITQNGGFWNGLIGLIVMSLPLFALPFIARQGGSVLGKVNGALQGLSNRAQKGVSDFSRNRRDLAMARVKDQNPDINEKTGKRRSAISAGGRRLIRDFGARKQKDKDELEARTESFKSQVRNNKVASAFTGRTIDGQAEHDRLTTAKQGAGLDAKESATRVRDANPMTPMGHLGDRTFAAGEAEKASTSDEEKRLSDKKFDPLRAKTEIAGKGAEEAKNKASERLEKNGAVLQVKKRVTDSENKYKAAQKVTEKAIAEDTTLDVARAELEKATRLASAATDEAAARTEGDSEVVEAKAVAATAADTKDTAVKASDKIVDDAKRGIATPGVITQTTADSAQTARRDLEEATLQATESSEDLAAAISGDDTLDEARLRTEAAKLRHGAEDNANAQQAAEAATKEVGTGILADPALAATRASMRASKQATSERAAARAGAERTAQAEYDYEILHTPGVAARAGGIEPGGEAKQVAEASQRTYSRNKELVARAVDRLVETGVTQDEARDVARGDTSVTTKTGAVLDGSTDFPMRQAGIQQVVLTNDVEGVSDIWDSIAYLGDPTYGIRGASEEIKTIRRTLAETLVQADGRPVWLGRGVIGGMEMGGTPPTTTELIKKAIDDNAYGVKATAKEDKDALMKIYRLATSGVLSHDQKVKMKDRATRALADPQYGPDVAKNLEVLTLLSRLIV